MTHSLKARLDSVFKDIETEAGRDGRLTVIATAESVVPVLRFLKEAGHDYLQLVSCVDWIDRGEIEVVYVLSSYLRTGGEAKDDPAEIVLKTRLPRSAPSLPTSIPVFPAAEPYEREMHELYGVHFEGHPRLTPLFLEREYEIPPFRKDFDTRQYVKDLFGGIPPVGEKS